MAEIGASDAFEPLDRQLADLLAGDEAKEIHRQVMLLSAAVREGHVCLPVPSALHPSMRASQAVGEPGAAKPLILDAEGRLYFHRYWRYESRLAQRLLKQAKSEIEAPPPAWLDRQLSSLFPNAPSQRRAAQTAANQALCLISGGPGTGKTTTVAGLIAALLAWRPALQIELAAPTGKAAARMQQALVEAGRRLPISPEVGKLMPATAKTLHRLLGYRADSVAFRHHRDNPLPADVVVVDEASMIDLALMSKLLEAVRPDTRLILLGDKDQLASVEAGAVLGEICAAAKQTKLEENLVFLDRSYRFDAAAGLGQLAKAVNAGQTEEVLALLRDPAVTGITLHEQGSAGKLAIPQLQHQLQPWRRGCDPNEGLAAFERFQVLCVHRQGRYGVAGLNRSLERGLFNSTVMPDWYPGRPVMILENDYRSGLYNGDIGIAGGGERGLRVFFHQQSAIAHFLPARLPAHQTAYAMTVHKAQGSEFDEILLILPPEDSPLLTRELIYTAITRARQKVCILGSISAIEQAVSRPTQRRSGLRDQLINFK